MTNRLIGFVVMASFAVAGCSSEDNDPAGADDLTEQTGCAVLTEESTEELYVREKFTCGATAIVYTFNNSDGKTGWLEIAETFGVVLLDQGDLWVKVED